MMAAFGCDRTFPSASATAASAGTAKPLPTHFEDEAAEERGEDESDERAPSVDASRSPAGPFHGCPPDGDGGDRVLNRLKNRDADSAYAPMRLVDMIHLAVPEAPRIRERWPASARALVEPLEQRAVAVEGYLLKGKQEGAESPNCHDKHPWMRDFHLWLGSTPADARANSVVVELTPRIREKHPSWSLARLRKLVHDHTEVRVSGWLMLDPEHPDQVGKTRATVWEIHPIQQIEIRSGDGWIALDGAN